MADSIKSKRDPCRGTAASTIGMISPLAHYRPPDWWAENFNRFAKPICTRTSSLDAMREVRAEPLAPASDRLVADNYTSLEQKFFDVVRAQLKPEILTNRATNADRGETMTVVKRFFILHRKIVRHEHRNVTMPLELA
jgi:hypothetical protein